MADESLSVVPAWLPLLAQAGVPRSTISWPRAWAVIARSEVRQGREWGRSLLWRWRLWSYLGSLREARRCGVCGGEIGTQDARARHCGQPCRAVALRARRAGRPTAFEALLGHADLEFKRADDEVKESERWFDHARRRRTQIPPPHLLEYEHLPDLPTRCGKCGTNEPCDLTGGVCLHVQFERRPPSEVVRPQDAGPPAARGVTGSHGS